MRRGTPRLRLIVTRNFKGGTMQTTTITRTSSFASDGPRVVERTRGSAHPKVPTTRPTGEMRGAHRLGLSHRP